MLSETLNCWVLGTSRFQKLAPEPAAHRLHPAQHTPLLDRVPPALHWPRGGLRGGTASLSAAYTSPKQHCQVYSWVQPATFPDYHEAPLHLLCFPITTLLSALWSWGNILNSRPHQPPSFRKISSLFIFQFILSVPVLNTGGNTEFLQTQLSVSLLFG